MTTVPDPEDLTARARIRDAAMRHIGEHGFERATIRDIAESAGVSLGLVRHHFGSKQALREACDEQLMKTIRRLSEQAASDPYGAGLNPAAVLGPYQPYLARALTEGWAAPLFDEMVDLGEGWIIEADRSRPDPPDVDARSRSTMIAAMALSATVLRQHVERGMGVDLTSPEGQVKLMRVMVDLYSHPLLSLEEAAEARKALDRGATA